MVESIGNIYHLCLKMFLCWQNATTALLGLCILFLHVYHIQLKSGLSFSPRSQGWAFLFEPKHWGAALIISSQPLGAGWVHSDGDSYWQRTAPSQHLLLPHHSGQTFIGAQPAQTPSLLTFFISKNRLGAERIHVSGPLRLAADISAALLTSFPPIPSLFFPCDFSKGKFLSEMEKWVWIKYSQLACDEGQL